MDKTKIDLNAPAFGSNAQKVSDLEPKETSTEVSEDSQPKEVVEEVKEEETVKETKTSDEEIEEQKVPYSRFKKFHSRALEAERLAEEARQEAEEWRRKAETHESKVEQTDVALPSWWLALYGDSEASVEAWKVQSKANADFQEKVTREAREKALDAVKNERYEEENRVKENLKKIDSNFEQLETFVGRELSEKEQSSILDIVNEYTPKDERGNYYNETLSFEKAWEIYELKTNAQKAPKTKARDEVAALNSSTSQGDPSAEAEKDKNFNPLDWNAWKKRI